MGWSGTGSLDTTPAERLPDWSCVALPNVLMVDFRVVDIPCLEFI
jgi:hypothetical protein